MKVQAIVAKVLYKCNIHFEKIIFLYRVNVYGSLVRSAKFYLLYDLQQQLKHSQENDVYIKSIQWTQ